MQTPTILSLIAHKLILVPILLLFPISSIVVSTANNHSDGAQQLPHFVRLPLVHDLHLRVFLAVIQLDRVLASYDIPQMGQLVLFCIAQNVLDVAGHERQD